MGKKSSGKTATVRVKAKLARMIEIIATAEKKSSADILDPIIRPQIQTRYDAALKTLAAEGKELRKDEDDEDDE